MRREPVAFRLELSDFGGFYERTYHAAYRTALGIVRVLARPTDTGRALATFEIPIEGRDEWLAAARRLA